MHCVELHGTRLPKAAVQYSTYSPVGARAAVGSCPHTPCATSAAVYGPSGPFVEMAWRTRELDIHTTMPVLCVISAAYIW